MEAPPFLRRGDIAPRAAETAACVLRFSAMISSNERTRTLQLTTPTTNDERRTTNA
jgi:hypothetical protein